MNALHQLTCDLTPADQKAASDVVDGLCRLAACGVVPPDHLEAIMQTLAQDLADSWALRNTTSG